jgi:hypothetical protein
MLAGRVVDEAVAGKGWWAAVGRALVAEMRGGFGGTKGKRAGDGVVEGQFAGEKMRKSDSGTVAVIVGSADQKGWWWWWWYLWW